MFAVLCLVHELTPEELLADLTLVGADELHLRFDAPIFSEYAGLDELAEFTDACISLVETACRKAAEYFSLNVDDPDEYARFDVAIRHPRNDSVTLRFPHAPVPDGAPADAQPLGRLAAQILKDMVSTVHSADGLLWQEVRYATGEYDREQVLGFDDILSDSPVTSDMCRAMGQLAGWRGSKCRLRFSWAMDLLPPPGGWGWMEFDSFDIGEFFHAADDLEKIE
ncbi:hypothetical protein TH66_17745 [Carbonactinospora thermoautotrophica]|uniref:Uncharacterized protein n=1 Tax=Carbonactinospora thermoautotrophica TaxID=1469144 RepID=A0A132MHZ8_9ACTN|nr:hypothetical protein [Carbonactinospora thermoautotrophica]KWW97480.1 hypothetical protein TH66_17745 [Carbonactinospora thermoautotrophica]KWX07111.1 hypothetical protein TR74_19845 [Carbonactinospora thermoautotrophica]